MLKYVIESNVKSEMCKWLQAYFNYLSEVSLIMIEILATKLSNGVIVVGFKWCRASRCSGGPICRGRRWRGTRHG